MVQSPVILIFGAVCLCGLAALLTLIMRVQSPRASTVRTSRVAMVLSALGAAVTLLVTFVRVGNLLLSKAVPVSIPVQPFWPQLPREITITAGPTAEIVGGGFTVANLELSNLSWGSKILLAAGELSLGTLLALLILLVYFIARNLAYGNSVRSSLASRASLAAYASLFLGMGSEILTALGSHNAAEEAIGVSGWAVQSLNDSAPVNYELADFWPKPELITFTIPWWPVVLALVFAVLTAFFRSHQRLQEDVAGLV